MSVATSKGVDKSPMEDIINLPFDAFVEHIQIHHAQVHKLFSLAHLKVLQLDPNTPYKEDNIHETFIRYYGNFFYFKHIQSYLQTSAQNKLCKPPTKVLAGIDFSQFDNMVLGLKKVCAKLEHILKSKLNKTEEEMGEKALPRVIKLNRKYNLSDKESLALIFTTCIAVCQEGTPNNWAMGRNLLDYLQPYQSALCKACDMTTTDFLHFLDQDRPIIQQGIFPEIQTNYTLNCTLNMDEVVLKGIIGAHLRTSEFMKLEQTSLAEIIAVEEGNEQYRDLCALSKGLAPSLMGDKDRVPTISDKDLPEKMDIVSDKGSHTSSGSKSATDRIPFSDLSELPPELLELDPDDNDLATLLRRERLLEEHKKKMIEKARTEGGEATEEVKDAPELSDDIVLDTDKLTPYKTDLEYLDDNFQLISLMLKIKGLEKRIEQEALYDENFKDVRTHRQKRESEYKTKVQSRKCEKRLELTRQTGSWIPRLERLVISRGLCPFEKNLVLTLIGSIIQPNKINNCGDMNPYATSSSTSFSVGELLRLFCTSLTEQIKHRTFFYKNAKLVREGMIVVHDVGITGDPSSAKVEVDRRMLDFSVGLDTEFSEVVEGSHLYFPKTKFNNVILSGEQKELILSTVSNFDTYRRCRKKLGLDDIITYGAGLVLLFHGPPGTGKTMMANALANRLERKVLLINFPSLGSMSAGENFKFIFREAKINDAILFFDECEGIFESREKGGHNINLLLTEIERHDGLMIMATNRPYDLDEAMHRRITIALEFPKPDHILRKEIWGSHIPASMKLADDVDLSELALRFELTGGFIKNSILSALSIAVSREGDTPYVCQDDLLKGASLQLRGRLRMKDFDRRVIPSVGLDEVVVNDNILSSLKEIVQYEKARAVLFGQWGFGKTASRGLAVLMHGKPGTGKSHSAEAIGYEVGKPLKVVNCGELLSKWVGESSKNIDSLFEESKNMDAILLFDDCDGLFGSRTSMGSSTDRYANVDVGVLLYHIERFPGIVIMTTNVIENLDKAFYRRFRYMLHFETPNQSDRAKLWKLLIPKETPVKDKIDFNALSAHEMTGGSIKNCIFRAAAKAALRSVPERMITTDDLIKAAVAELNKANRNLGDIKNIYS
ncbi:hypothetical protein LOD99_15675 [Oopsacas minuta]|uniref:AAA+ ATPase domain-containing protein n=1 Tax=Oopsacas minuta TaxID=111878 RepID=A0AAV7K9N4_9METZ|nr:hypothetical protein LOD99_15675 [Oopsacas minuta]